MPDSLLIKGCPCLEYLWRHILLRYMCHYYTPSDTLAAVKCSCGRLLTHFHSKSSPFGKEHDRSVLAGAAEHGDPEETAIRKIHTYTSSRQPRLQLTQSDLSLSPPAAAYVTTTTTSTTPTTSRQDPLVDSKAQRSACHVTEPLSPLRC